MGSRWTSRPSPGRRRSELITPVPPPRKETGEVGPDEHRYRHWMRTRPLDGGAGIHDQQPDQRHPQRRRKLAGAAEPGRPGRDPRHPAPAPALASPVVPDLHSVLLPGRGRRDGNLARRGRPAGSSLRASSASTCKAHNEQSQSGAVPHRTRKWRPAAARPPSWRCRSHGRQSMRPAHAREQPLQPRFPRRRSGHHHQGPAPHVLQPNDPESYYRGRELVPADMLPDIDRAKIVITNYHVLQTARDAGNQQDWPLPPPRSGSAPGHHHRE